MTEDAYAVRADALKEKLYGMAWLYLGSQSLAVDAVDEAVYRGLRSCGKLRDPSDRVWVGLSKKQRCLQA